MQLYRWESILLPAEGLLKEDYVKAFQNIVCDHYRVFLFGRPQCCALNRRSPLLLKLSGNALGLDGNIVLSCNRAPSECARSGNGRNGANFTADDDDDNRALNSTREGEGGKLQ